ncbi:MAG: TfoX/Sxy family protein [Planctomycetia bacterium]|nr:TfoX/Sxy family protein [Planctomycetia bacterium]
MTYSLSLADRVRHALRAHHGIAEKKMFGGLCFLLGGNMLVGIMRSSLIVRLGAEAAADALKQEHVGEFDATGRPMKGWIVVDGEGLESDRRLASWIDQACAFVETLPVK